MRQSVRMYEPTLNTRMKPTPLVTNGSTFHNGLYLRSTSQMDDTAYKAGTFTQHDPEHTWQAGPGKSAWLWKNKQTSEGHSWTKSFHNEDM